MSLRLSIEGASPAGPGIWRASIQPSWVRMLGPNATSSGALNVLLVSGLPTYDPTGKVLSFPADSARVLNVGSCPDAVILHDTQPSKVTLDTGQGRPRTPAASDAEFLGSVPLPMRSLAESLVSAVRSHLAGKLVLREPSGRYVETPDNFWTIKVQPRVQTFRITLRGRPQSFSSPSSFHLKDDRPGYSTFVLSHAKQVEDAVRAIREAATH